MTRAIAAGARGVETTDAFLALSSVLRPLLAAARNELDRDAAARDRAGMAAAFLARIDPLARVLSVSGPPAAARLAARMTALAKHLEAAAAPGEEKRLALLVRACLRLEGHFVSPPPASDEPSADGDDRLGGLARTAALREARLEVLRMGARLDDRWHGIGAPASLPGFVATAGRLASVLAFLDIPGPAQCLQGLASLFGDRTEMVAKANRELQNRIADVLIAIAHDLASRQRNGGERGCANEYSDSALAAIAAVVETLEPATPSAVSVPPAATIDWPPVRAERLETTVAEIFLRETSVIVPKLDAHCVHWRGNPVADRTALAALYRLFECLAGSAATAGAPRLSAFSAAIAELLHRLQTGLLPNTPARVAIVSQFVAMMPRLCEEFASGTEATADAAALLREAREVGRLDASAAEDAAAGNDDVGAGTSPEPQADGSARIPRLEPELYAIYRSEALEHLAVLDSAGSAWERGEEFAIGEEPRRAAHTLAGCSKMAGVAEMGTLMSELEEVLERAAGAGTDPRALLVPMAIATDTARALVHAYGDGQSALPSVREAQERLKALRDVLPPRPAVSPDDSGDATQDSAAAGGDPELVQLFTGEAAELLEGADASLRAWRADPSASEPASELLRRLHTLKGGARMAGLAPFADLVHELETFLTRIVDGMLEVSAGRLELAEHALDNLHGMLEELADARQPTPADGLRAELRSESERAAAALAVRAVLPEASEADEGQEADQPRSRDFRPGLARVRTDLLEAAINGAGEVGIYRGRVGQQLGAMNVHLGELERTVERLRSQMRELEMEVEAQIISTREQRRAANLAEFDPLEFDRYTHIHELSRSLAEAVSDLTSLRSLFATGLRLAGTALDRQGRVNAELQDALLRTRMMPFALSEGRLRRLVRLVAEESGKRIDFRFTDMGGEMDRLVLDHVLPALEHLLRNAVVHGIESVAERRRAGKPAAGRIELLQRREGAETVVEVADDGGGFDFAAIRARAEREGLIEPAAAVSEGELVDLVFRLGFTTADRLSQTAGRGVGMNVVAAEARYVGGTVEIVSRAGEGTRMLLRFPATLAIGHSLLIRVGTRRYLVPLAGIGSIARVARTLLEGHLKSDTPSYEQGGESWQLVSLARALGEEAAPPENQADRVPLLLIRVGNRRVAFVADDMEGSREVVIKPVGPQVAHIAGISGATFFDDGSIGLLLDLAGLVRATGQWETGPAPAPSGAASRREPLVMVADDSITVRRVTERLLARHAVRVLGARDGVEALELLADHKPDLLLLDIEMPRMNGYELAEHMRNDERLREIPIIIITSRVGEKHRARAAALGIRHYLGKPYLESELLGAIRSVMGGLETPAAAGGDTAQAS
ncbi:MAG TPA: response regulator [Gammaproteobacteria bacterium]|nr:response regulator [Gammaproteobacteria bacterium]